MKAEKKRLVSLFFMINGIAIVSACLLLLLALLNSYVDIPFTDCYFHKYLHLYCPLCGGTRAFMAIIRFDIVSALKYNAFAVYLFALAIYYEIKSGIMAFRGNSKAFDLPIWLLCLTGGMFVLYFVGRNLLMIILGFDPTGDLVVYWA